ncbi:MAG: hypothetical protein ACLQDI_03920, partial [Syntrophobacteraceae bacterium]
LIQRPVDEPDCMFTWPSVGGRIRNLSRGTEKKGCDSVATADRKEATIISAIATQNQRKIFI